MINILSWNGSSRTCYRDTCIRMRAVEADNPGVAVAFMNRVII
jgi:hypothetical protein